MKQPAQKQTDKVPVVCARCGWRGKRSPTTAWPACPRCCARAELILQVVDSKQRRHGEIIRGDFKVQ